MPDLIANNLVDAENDRDEMVNNLRLFMNSLETLIWIGESYVVNSSSLDADALEKCKEQFIEAAKGYNYHLSLFNDKTVRSSLEKVQEKRALPE